MTKKTPNDRSLTIENLNPRVIEVEYAVRGPIVIRAAEIEKQLKEGNHKYPFDRVIRANIGDCHASGNQVPVTYIRQLVAGCTYPPIMNSKDFPSDIKQKVERLLCSCGGKSLGAYTESQGIMTIREDIANYIQERDGYPANASDIYLCNGASDGIKTVLKLLMNNDAKKPSGIMIPVPQYPLYSATLSEYGAYQIEYYLDEDNNWALDIDELERALNESKDRCVPRGIVIINPGNPTGQVLSRENIKNIICFAKKHRLFILADEVYQENVHLSDSKFFSFKKVLMDLGPPYKNMEMASFHSASKGWHGECGSRGGYYELINIDNDVRMQVNKLISACLCSTAWGQSVMGAIINPPKPGEQSYELYNKERTEVVNRLKEKADLVSKLFNSIEGVKCNPVMGAMYAFPRIEIPEKAIEHAKSKQMAPDAFYCFQLLDKTGICVVPGSGFKQRPGTHHLRTTILPPVDQMKDMVEKFRAFHIEFLNEWK
ncbi:unnamed protein product [Adineta steineri]|uniref:alanine transaminase n=1 Tax=Adineta steineri TaxID=433720 RepID=A0A819SLA7_9BILA|nr:unnamed protein product [Adineta steineri]CAF0735028.1 unnamed protein product [Adineta steineri]CAF3497672.1 unnamed protein product [Adineta steineri]CAF4064749.1 unnamed protein product [Adineta steineri]